MRPASTTTCSTSATRVDEVAHVPPQAELARPGRGHGRREHRRPAPEHDEPGRPQAAQRRQLRRRRRRCRLRRHLRRPARTRTRATSRRCRGSADVERPRHVHRRRCRTSRTASTIRSLGQVVKKTTDGSASARSRRSRHTLTCAPAVDPPGQRRRLRRRRRPDRPLLRQGRQRRRPRALGRRHLARRQRDSDRQGRLRRDRGRRRRREEHLHVDEPEEGVRDHQGGRRRPGRSPSTSRRRTRSRSCRAARRRRSRTRSGSASCSPTSTPSTSARSAI